MAEPTGGWSAAEAIRHALRGVIDPEIGLSVVDVGLIYDIRLQPDGVTVIDITTTSRGCPAAGYLTAAVRDRAREAVGTAVEVRLVYEPSWSPGMMKS